MDAHKPAPLPHSHLCKPKILATMVVGASAEARDQLAGDPDSQFQRRLRGRPHAEWRCPLCNQAFKKREHMVRHTHSHTKERPFVCSICRKTYGRQYVPPKHVLSCLSLLTMLKRLFDPARPKAQSCGRKPGFGGEASSALTPRCISVKQEVVGRWCWRRCRRSCCSQPIFNLPAAQYSSWCITRAGSFESINRLP